MLKIEIVGLQSEAIKYSLSCLFKSTFTRRPYEALTIKEERIQFQRQKLNFHSFCSSKFICLKPSTSLRRRFISLEFPKKTHSPNPLQPLLTPSRYILPSCSSPLCSRVDFLGDKGWGDFLPNGAQFRIFKITRIQKNYINSFQIFSLLSMFQRHGRLCNIAKVLTLSTL